MKSKKRTKALTALLVSLLLLLCSAAVFRAEEQRGEISVCFELSDARFVLYRVGEITDSGVVLAAPFKGYPVDLNSESAAQTLSAYIERDQIAPDAEARTDARGIAVFSGLPRGVYLAHGESTAVDDVMYCVMPSLISLPHTMEDEAKWEINSYVKYAKYSCEQRAQIDCIKVWKSDTEMSVYPDITVQLLKNGEVYDTAVLNEQNSWKYSWSDLDPYAVWTVTEEELDGDYSVDISRENNVFTITNTVGRVGAVRRRPQETTAPTTVPETTAPSSATPATGSEAAASDRLNPSGSAMIPQTGQLNWPVPVLSFIGIVLILLGVLSLRKNHEE